MGSNMGTRSASLRLARSLRTNLIEQNICTRKEIQSCPSILKLRAIEPAIEPFRYEICELKVPSTIPRLNRLNHLVFPRVIGSLLWLGDPDILRHPSAREKVIIVN